MKKFIQRKKIAPLVSSSQKKYLQQLKRNKIQIIIWQISIFASFILLWEIAVRLRWIDGFLFSSPTRVFNMARRLLDDRIFFHMGVTLLECILGFLISTVLGILIAIGLWWSQKARKILEPYLIVLNALPKVALGPMIIVWVGIGMQAIILMTILICVIVAIISILNGFLNIDEGKVLLLKSMGATKFQILFRLILPGSLPNILSALKVNIGLAWVGTIMGEYLASRAGLGYLILYGGQVFRMDLVVTSIVILCVLAALMYLGVAILEKKLIKNYK
ncbi:MAG: ABC transporter permease [Firmicutes bacterium]|nr:ABC transporter permease [Bacillota bacterium]